MTQDRAASFLQLIRRAQHGRLKVYLGYGPGVGKTYQMLTEAHRLKSDGIDVVVGLVETHGRPETATLIEGLEVVPRRRVDYRGMTIEEMDVDAILARKPKVALVDELAHTNAPDSRNEKRYQDVHELLAAGIHVISTLNVQHLESLYNTVENLLGVKVRERIPDSVLAEADVVVNVDLAAEDLQRRLREGKVYPKDRSTRALENFFTQSNLEQLRELAFREVASQLDFRRRETAAAAPDARQAGGSDQVMVCLSSGGPNSARLLRYGSRLAGRLNRNWYAVYVQTPKEDPTLIDARVQRLLADSLTLANQLGATVFTFRGQDIADTILRFAREYRVGNVIIGQPHRTPWWRRLMGYKSIAEQLILRATGVTVIVVDATTEQSAGAEMPLDSMPATMTSKASQVGTIGSLLRLQRVLIWEDPVSRDDIFCQLATTFAGPGMPATEELVSKLREREAGGSTFLNEGVALPHARIAGLTLPHIAIGLTHGGVMDSPSEKPVDVVFMLLTPTDGTTHLQLLAKASRMLQNQDLRRRLAKVKSSEEAIQQIQEWEQPAASKRA